MDPVQDNNPQVINVANTSTPPPSNRLKGIVLVVIIAILVLASFIVVIVLIQTNQKAPTKVQTTDTSQTPFNSPTENIIKPYRGEKTITLEDKSGQGFSGKAKRVRTETYSTYQIETDLIDPVEGNFYQAWISNANGQYQQALGKLSKNEEGKYVLDANHEFSEPPQGTLEEIPNIIFVSLDANDDNFPEKIMLQGDFLN